eukprot:6190885-Pleurochrysis_carterae.AAC.6
MGVGAFALANRHHTCHPFNVCLQQRFHGQRLGTARGRLCQSHIFPAFHRRAAARNVAPVRVDDTPFAHRGLDRLLLYHRGSVNLLSSLIASDAASSAWASPPTVLIGCAAPSGDITRGAQRDS